RRLGVSSSMSRPAGPLLLPSWAPASADRGGAGSATAARQARRRAIARQREAKPRASPRSVLGPDPPSVPLDDRPADREPEARPTRIVARASVELLEHALQLIRRQSRAAVRDIERDLRIVRVNANLNWGPGQRV